VVVTPTVRLCARVLVGACAFLLNSCLWVSQAPLLQPSADFVPPFAPGHYALTFIDPDGAHDAGRPAEISAGKGGALLLHLDYPGDFSIVGVPLAAPGRQLWLAQILPVGPNAPSQTAYFYALIERHSDKFLVDTMDCDRNQALAIRSGGSVTSGGGLDVKLCQFADRAALERGATAYAAEHPDLMPDYILSTAR